MTPSNSKAAMIAGGLFVLVSLTIIPAVVHPRLNPGYYSKFIPFFIVFLCNLFVLGEKQKWIRDEVPLEKTQPGGKQKYMHYNLEW